MLQEAILYCIAYFDPNGTGWVNILANDEKEAKELFAKQYPKYTFNSICPLFDQNPKTK